MINVSTMLSRNILFSFVAMSMLGYVPAQADDSPISTSDFASPQVRTGVQSAETASAQPLNGQVQADAYRIRRGAPSNTVLRGSQPAKLTGTIEKNKVTMPQMTLVESADYSATVNTPPPPPPPPKKRGTMVWGQSLAGGYYDSTGQVKEVVRGDELYKYGGTFQDGVAVPEYPVTCNFAGHTYRPFVRKLVRN